MEPDHPTFHDAVLEFLPDATFVIDLEGRVVAWNRAMELLTGVPKEEMLGRGNYEYALPFYHRRRPLLANLVFMPEAELEARYDTVERIGDTLVVDIAIPEMRPGGAVLWAKAGPLYDAEGRVTGAIETVRDITERKRAEREIRQTRRRLEDIISFLPDATFAIDRDGTVVTWNREMERLTGIPAASMLGKGDLEYALPFYGYRRPMLANLVLMPEAEVESRYNHVERDGDTLLVDTLIPNLPGGPGRYYWAKASPLYDLAGDVVGAIETIRDTTARRQMEERLARSNAELAIAADIQSSFLPDAIPQLAGFEVAAKSLMAREVGGDFFDAVPLEVIRIGQDRLGLLIADVSGKGVPAALFMALSRIVVRVNATWHHRAPAEAIRDANAVIARDAKGGMFVTLFYGVLDAHEHSLTYVNAGHNPPLVYRAVDGSFSELAPTGIAIGAVPDADYSAGAAVLEPGDVAVLYTDGITEAENDAAEFYGEDRLRAAIAESSRLPAGAMVDAILGSVQAFSGAVPQSDDITLMVVRKV